ncbi:GNAT family N-acetyltransferase [Aeromonas rivipollensis]|uniref:GNAT family N-acetyltransferase n=1 Tax=Aeromonas rivipollensis TaxID=948519 RepID=UPI001F2FD9DD|nr:GNAT family N-acetyltransferase [Aeromonas rivipollensis]MCE9944688.1 GNAT family N-acetyltransferase [Aeromonas rivipollensis]
MELLIEEALWQPRWQGALQAWQGQGNRWQLLHGRRCEQGAVAPVPWAGCPPDGILSASGLLAAWLGEGESPLMTADPSRQILVSASSVLLTLAKESGLLTLGPNGADMLLGADGDLAAALQRLLARRLTTPLLREPGGAASPALVLRPLQAADEPAVLRYCSDEALARYTLNIPHPYPAEAARDWLAMSGRKAALGLGRTWALTLPMGDEPAPLLGVISLHWHGELAWWVGVPWQNRGLATRAALLVRAFAFEQLRLPALTARHMPGNLASGRVMAKLGMHHCGRRPGSARQPAELDHWRLDRPPRLPDDLKEALAPWLEDERVAVAILHEDEVGGQEVALFMEGAGAGGERRLPAGLTVRCYPLAWLAPGAPGVQAHGGGVLLKDRGELGLGYLLRLLEPGV